MDPILILIIVLGAGAIFYLFQQRKRLTNQAKNSLHAMNDEGFEFRADEASPSPTGKFRVQQMMRSTEGRFGQQPEDGGDSGPTLRNPFERQEEDDE
jgi:hypothetical protein